MPGSHAGAIASFGCSAPAFPFWACAEGGAGLGSRVESNARDYSADDIERIAGGFGPEMVEALIAARCVFVAVFAGEIVGTAGLESGSVRTVFVPPAAQSHGVGRRLMQEIEAVAIASGIRSLALRSSITAEGFYRRLGYRAEAEEVRGTERVIAMVKDLAEIAPQSTMA